MKFVRRLLVFKAVFFTVSFNIYAAGVDCSTVLLQGELQAQLSAYKAHPGSRMRIFPAGSEFSASSSKRPVLSFGSGPDVLNPIVVSPNAAEIHLVDELSYWGLGPGQIVREIRRRLHSLPNARVSVVDQGFTRFIDPGKFEPPRGVTHLTEENEAMLKAHFAFPEEFWDRFGQGDHARPLILQVEWQSGSEGEQSRRVFLHPLNYDKIEHIEILNSSLVGPLSAIVVTGAFPPTRLLDYVTRLEPGGQLFLEIDTHHPDNETVFNYWIEALKPYGDLKFAQPPVYAGGKHERLLVLIRN